MRDATVVIGTSTQDTICIICIAASRTICVYDRSEILGYDYDGPTDLSPSPAKAMRGPRGSPALESGLETGLDYFGARYFSGAQGRFTTPDWSEKPQPVPYADLSNPQSLNLYAYVRNNPLTNRDPDGHWCLMGIGTTCGGNIPPPPKPPPPSVDQNALRSSLASFHPRGTQDSIRTIAGIVAHETRGMRDAEGANECLSSARQKIAHVRINTERKWGENVDSRAGMATPLFGVAEFAPALQSAINAALSDALGIDPTHGAINYNMRKGLADRSDFQGQSLHTQSGPYFSPTPYKVINTYGPNYER